MKWLYSGYAVVLSIALLLGLRIVDPTPLQSLRSQVFDSYQQLDEVKQSDNVVLINIGEKSLAKYGQYPFPRQYYAQLVVDVAMKNSGPVGWTDFRETKVLQEYYNKMLLTFQVLEKIL